MGSLNVCDYIIFYFFCCVVLLIVNLCDEFCWRNKYTKKKHTLRDLLFKQHRKKISVRSPTIVWEFRQFEKHASNMIIPMPKPLIIMTLEPNNSQRKTSWQQPLCVCVEFFQQSFSDLYMCTENHRTFYYFCFLSTGSQTI